jgi:hypothetical protein
MNKGGAKKKVDKMELEPIRERLPRVAKNKIEDKKTLEKAVAEVAATKRKQLKEKKDNTKKLMDEYAEKFSRFSIGNPQNASPGRNPFMVKNQLKWSPNSSEKKPKAKESSSNSFTKALRRLGI